MGITEIREEKLSDRTNRFYKDIPLGAINDSSNILFTIVLDATHLNIAGELKYFCPENKLTKLCYCINDQEHEIQNVSVDRQFNQQTGLFQHTRITFETNIPLSDNESNIRLIEYVNDSKHYIKNFKCPWHSQLIRKYVSSYYYSCGNVIKLKGQGSIIFVKKSNFFDRMNFEIRFIKRLIVKKVPGIVSIAAMRLKLIAKSMTLKKPIWLISDRLNSAGDNGEAFFRYLNAEKSNLIDSYFIISKSSAEYERIKSIGKVVEPYSHKHKILHMLAEYSASSQTDMFARNPFNDRASMECYRDFVNGTKFVFLQHGIIVEDLVDWLNKRKQNFYGFVVSTDREARDILFHNYRYTQNNIWLTGLPRYDLLSKCKRKSEGKSIVFMPTWRKYLAIRQNEGTGFWDLSPNFTSSNYYQTYKAVMEDERLLDFLKKHRYKLCFKVHPSFSGNTKIFDFSSKSVRVIGNEESYKDIFNNADLVISDYSSSALDFSYLRKPVIYFQFDRDEFWSGEHIYKKGNFDYAIDGLGEVVLEKDELIDKIIEYVKQDCNLKPMYRERINAFFTYDDTKNCERLFNMMIKNRHF